MIFPIRKEPTKMIDPSPCLSSILKQFSYSIFQLPQLISRLNTLHPLQSAGSDSHQN